LRGVGAVVDARAAELQARALAGVPSAIAALARLRRGVGKQPGELLDILEFTLSDEFFVGRIDLGASRDEKAAHVALTLFALHQQSQSRKMHRRGIGLGAALRALHAGDGDALPAPLLRRFQVLGTANSLDELAHHLRGAVQMLRAGGVGLDYGMLAGELVDWQRPDGPIRIRLRWGRDFFRQHRADTTSTEATDDDTPPTEANSSDIPSA
jgi:CRISPR system Cascade subunit CasB